jgi:hypothetical protein
MRSNTSLGTKKLISEQRLEILDYYEMNQKYIDINNKGKDFQENVDFFKDVKKINEMLVGEIKMKKEKEEESKNGVSSAASMKSMTMKNSRSVSTYRPPRKDNITSPKSINKAATPTVKTLRNTSQPKIVDRSLIGKKLDFNKSPVGEVESK